MIINQVVKGGGTPTPTEKYQLLSRVTDDSNNEIGTVCGYHIDANNQKYAVVCLDAQYRSTSGKIIGSGGVITGLPQYTDRSAYNAPETATFNCDKILEQATSSSSYSTAVSHCRSKSFVIDGTTYYGQVPTIGELLSVYIVMSQIDALDTSAASNPTLVLPTTSGVWSSTQTSSGKNFRFWTGGVLDHYYTYGDYFIIPVLEIPIQ